MAQDIKAGIPFTLKVNTKADKMGFESGFSLHYFDDATKTVVKPTVTFVEFIDTLVDGTNATTVSAAVALGGTVIPLTSTTGYAAGQSVAIGTAYYRITAVSATDITLKRGIEVALVGGEAVTVSGRTGTYGADLTIPAAGKYTIHITNFAIGMDNEPAPIHVAAATVDDVKTLLDSVNTDLTSVKTQVDFLDEASLNGLSAQVGSVSANLDAVHTLLKDTSDVYVELNADESANYVIGDILTGNTSGATGTIQYIGYDATLAVTKITMQSATGTFVAGETVTNGTTISVGTITTIKNNVVNSVIEFVDEIKGLLSSSSGLDVLKNLNLDLEIMMRGDALLSDGVTANPTAGKGLAQIFDELVLNHADLTALKTLAEDTTNGFIAIKNAVVAGQTSIEAKIAAFLDETNPLSLISKVNGVKTVVDANAASLADTISGLPALRTQLDNISALFATGGNVTLRFDAIDTAIGTLSTDLANQTTTIMTGISDLSTQIAAGNDATRYSVFA